MRTVPSVSMMMMPSMSAAGAAKDQESEVRGS